MAKKKTDEIQKVEIKQSPPHPGQVHHDHFHRYTDYEIFREEYKKLYPDKNWQDKISGFRHLTRYSWADMLVYVKCTASAVGEDFWRKIWEDYNVYLDAQFNCSHIWMMSLNRNVNSYETSEYDFLGKICILCTKKELEKFNFDAKRRTDLKYDEIWQRSRYDLMRTIDLIEAATEAKRNQEKLEESKEIQ